MKEILAFVTLWTILGSAQCQSSPRGAVEAATLPSAPEAMGPAQGQDFSAANSPSATAPSSTGDPQQTKRILGIIPNFRSVSSNVTLPPQSGWDKLTTGLQDSFDYSAFIFVGVQAGLSQWGNSYPSFHQGASGYGRYYWHTFADQADENLLVESLLPAVLHEDSRYYTLGHGGFLKRTRYSLTRSFITRNDNGDNTLNVAEIVGSGAAAGISSTYYPSHYRTWTKTGQRWLTNYLLDSATLVAKEFWPDINRAVFRHRD